MKLRIYGFKDYMFENIAPLGSGCTTGFDRLCAFLIAVSPILQFYKGLYRNAGFTIILLVSPLLFIRLLVILKSGRCEKKCLYAVIPLVLFQLFKMIDHSINFNKLLYGVFFVLVFIAIAIGCINVKLVIKYATAVCLLASILLVLQYFCYYILGFHLQLAPTSLFSSSSTGWILEAQTGRYGIRGIRTDFYRPSAFFMEPSHLFLYAFPVLCVFLFSTDHYPSHRRFCIWVTIALVLSTSGMGVAVAAALWVVYFALYYGNNRERNMARMKNLFSTRNILILLGLILLLFLLYFSVPVFQQTVNRFLVRSGTGSSQAIDGRNRLARRLVSGLSGKRLLLGVTEDLGDLDFNLPGFYATVYKYGAIGIFLSYWYYAQHVFRLKGSGFWITVVILIVSFFSAHTHGTFYMLYFVLFLMNGLCINKRESSSLHTSRRRKRSLGYLE